MKAVIRSVHLFFIVFTSLGTCFFTENLLAAEGPFRFPSEDSLHEGTWLCWPHDFTYGLGNRDTLEPIWISMTEALSEGEKVHIIAYNNREKAHIEKVLVDSDTRMENIDFYIFPNDDTWIRDNGPIFLRDSTGELVISDWGFNGWGGKCRFEKDDLIPSLIAKETKMKIVNIDMVLEGGSIESDGHGTCIATRSAVTNRNRNPHLTEDEIEKILSKYMGFTNFIWLDGVPGIDITDFHIDGFVKMVDQNTIMTMNRNDLIDEWSLSRQDYGRLQSAVNSAGRPYDFVHLPLSAMNVSGLDYKGSYLNFYVANTVVLVPIYNDPNDSMAMEIISKYYPNRRIVGIDIRELYRHGGMIHCVTQQQPAE